MAATRGTDQLTRAGVVFTLHPYDYDPGAEKIGMAAAEALGLDPHLALKCLMVEVDGKPACCVIPSDASLSMKKVAAAFGGKQAAMMLPAKAEKLTGYHTGGISPFGQRKAVPVALEVTVSTAEKVWINAGQRGLLLGIAPGDALTVSGGKAAALIA
ncbi:aminoacyl-tRNA deacylase [Paracoccus sp. IB05]|uniref:aminoacyl-tRNA deacylase n=1 Tax=Paracoccus sp. IB05 TaxID=2779367 RepID=UPI0018E7D504|nr:aminoacyl-tRNA deacylase [Paracoccus sp. IB05]MBJ2153685.1 aminoacyl-tRNA deacylase [Paracoccus sp. IB05]